MTVNDACTLGSVQEGCVSSLEKWDTEPSTSTSLDFHLSRVSLETTVLHLRESKSRVFTGKRKWQDKLHNYPADPLAVTV